MKLKQYIPPSVKVFLKVSMLSIKDILTLNILKYVSANGKKTTLLVRQTIEQQIVTNEYVQNKIENLLLATEKINHIIIPPGKQFSFNKIVGNPSAANGFKESRSIKNGIVVPEVGGGLCQLPWIMYHLCLQTGITILERHHHSKDIYNEQTRFAPLGSDATIVYGYKDFKILNNTTHDICFVFDVKQTVLSCSICSDASLPMNEVLFKEERSVNTVSVKTLINNEFFGEDIYLL